MFDSNAHFYEFGMKLWETLSQELKLQRYVFTERNYKPSSL